MLFVIALPYHKIAPYHSTFIHPILIIYATCPKYYLHSLKIHQQLLVSLAHLIYQSVVPGKLLWGSLLLLFVILLILFRRLRSAPSSIANLPTVMHYFVLFFYVLVYYVFYFFFFHYNPNIDLISSMCFHSFWVP